MKPIGIYIDHLGDGNKSRAIAIARQAPDHFTLIGSGLTGKSAALSVLELPDDQPQAAQHGAANDNLAGTRRRTRMISNWIEAAEPALLLVDVSLQVAALARLTATPTAYMRLSGKRDDQPHLEAFHAAEAVLCPYHCVLEAETTPQWLRDRSHYFPGLTPDIAPNRSADKRLLVVRDRQFNSLSTDKLLSLARTLPDWRIDVIGGHQSEAAQAANLYFHGWIDHPAHFVAESTIVMGTAGDGLIAAVSSAGKPFICLPQADPFGGQFEKAVRLEALNAATVCRRWPQNWKKTIAETLKRGEAMAALHDNAGAARAAELLLDIAYSAKRPAAFWSVQGNPLRFAKG